MSKNLKPMSLALGLAVCVSLTGCFSGSSDNKSSSNGNGGTTAETPVVEIEFPEGDPDVSAELGGPGFTGEGWTTVEAYPLGDTRAVKGGTISTSIRDWPGNLRRIGTASNTWLNYTIGDLCYQGLVTLNPNTLEYIPMLASHWKISEDKMTFTFRINPKAHWSDGKPVVAQDIVTSWKIRMDETILSPSSSLTYGKLNEPVATSKYIVEVTAKDQNWRNFLYFATMSILPDHEVGSITGTEYLDKFNYKLTAVTGPYNLHERDIDKDKSVVLSRRKDFWAKDSKWNEGLYNFDKIRFVVVQDPELSFQKTCKGELDFFYIQKSEWWAKDLPELDAVKNGWLVRQKIFNDAPNGVSGFAINMREAPMDDVNVRKALQCLYDRKTLIEKLAYNEYVPTNSFWPGSEYENPENPKVSYDPAQAVKLLSEAGWKKRGPDGVLVKDGKRLSLTLTWYSPAKEKFLTSFQESCSKAGVEIKLNRINPETTWKNLMERKFQMVSIGWGGLIFPNPETSLKSSLADKNDNNNITGFKSEECDELYKKYDVAFSQEERRNIIREIDKIVSNQHSYVLEWYQPCQRILFWNKFGIPNYGLHRTLEWEDAFASWWIDPEKSKALKQARREDTKLSSPPLELHYWEQQKAKAEQASNN